METTTLAQMDRLRARADQIDHRIGPIPGRDADAIAVELRAAADTIGVLGEAVEVLRAVLRTAKAEGRQ